MKRLIPLCYKCQNAMVQTDMFDKAQERVVGCKQLTAKAWTKGLKPDAPGQPEYQHSCPMVRMKRYPLSL